MSSQNLLDEMFPDTEIDADQMQKEADARKESGGNFKPFVSNYFLTKEKKKGLVSFLHEGLKFSLYSGTVKINGKDVPQNILALPGGDPISKAGHKARDFGVYAVIDWLNTYKNRNGDTVIKPQIKLLIRGNNTVQVIEKRKRDRRHGDGTLLGRKWELERMGSGPSTYYDVNAEEDEFIPDFTQMVTIQTQEGDKEIPLIEQPDWPDYDTDLDEGLQSVYTRKQMRPDYAMDWSDPAKVDTWVKMHLLNTPIERYIQCAQEFKKGGGSGSSSNDTGKVIDLTQAKAKTSEEKPKAADPIPSSEDADDEDRW